MLAEHHAADRIGAVDHGTVHRDRIHPWTGNAGCHAHHVCHHVHLLPSYLLSVSPTFAPVLCVSAMCSCNSSCGHMSSRFARDVKIVSQPRTFDAYLFFPLC